MILETGVLMSHKARGSFQGEFGDGKSQLDARLSLWNDIILNMDNQTVKRTKGKQTLQSYRDAYENEMWLLGAKAVEQGYADRVVTASCSQELMESTRSFTIMVFVFKLKVTMSGCPLITKPLRVDLDAPNTEEPEDHNMKVSKKMAEKLKKIAIDKVVNKKDQVKNISSVKVGK